MGAFAFLAPIGAYFGDFDQSGKLILLGLGLIAVVVLIWRGELIAARVKSVLKSFEAQT